jgi:membrane peptidoglycan carboxypeptidase
MFAKAPKSVRQTGGIVTLVGMSAVAAVLVAASVTPAMAVTGLAANSTLGIFDNLPDYLQIDQLAQKTSLYAKGSDGQDVLLASFYAQNREEVSLDEISPFVIDAAIATEDPRFYEHGGVDLIGTTRALLSNFIGGTVQGGSSITQQYVKNVLVQKAEGLSDPAARDAAYDEATETSAERKLKEMKLAIGLEQEYSKDEILTGYLNIASFGGRVYGIQSAAKTYFGVDAKDLTIEQAASLIATLNNPNNLRIDQEENLKDNESRRDYVISRMLAEGKISQAQHDKAVKAPLTPKITPSSTGCQSAGSSAYFCDYVTWIIRNDPAFGATEDERWNAFQRGGWKIMTTLNVGVQEAAANAEGTWVPRTFEGIEIGSAVVSVEVGTGRVIAMAQNKAYSNDPEITQTDPAYTSVNYSTDKLYGGSSGFQVGSTYKVFALAEWLKAGHGLGETVDGRAEVDGAPRKWSMSTFTNSCDGAGGADWSTINDGSNPGGIMDALTATTNSINTSYIAMSQKLDLCAIRKTAESLLVKRADGDVLASGPAATLGTNEISPLTMAVSFAGIANQGVVCSPIAIDKITDANGKDIPPPKSTCTQALTPQVANTVAYALRTVLTNGTGTASNPGDGIPIMGKTGTTDRAVHTWMVGGTTKVATAVWVGNVVGFSPTSSFNFNGVAGNRVRHQIFREIMATANGVYGGEAFGSPDSTMMGGGRSVPVPDTKGLTFDQAKQLLEAAGLSVQNGGGVDSELAVGKVVSTDPAVGTTINGAALVTVYTSNGTLVAGPPSQVGKTEAQARAALSSWTIRVVYLDPPADICRPVDGEEGDPEEAPTPTPTPVVTCVPAPNPNKGKVTKQTPRGGFVKSTAQVTLTVQN